MAKVETIEFNKPVGMSPDEVEQAFYTEINEVINKYYKLGMTATWQAGALSALVSALYNPEYEQ